MDNDKVTLRVAASELGISLRHCQRLAQRVADSDKEVAPNGAVKVQVQALKALLPSHDKPASPGDAGASEVASRVAALEAELASTKAALDDACRDRDRWYDAHRQAQQDASEWRRLLVASNPKLLPPPPDAHDVVVGQDTQTAPEPPQTGWWGRLWGRGG